MVLSAFKSSRHSGNTVDLFEFIYGDNPGDEFRYCNAERALDVDGVTYDPIAISRDSIKSKGREMGAQFNVEVPRTSDIARMFQGTPPRRVIFLRVYEGDVPEFDSPSEWSAQTPVVNLIWAGRVLEAMHKPETTTLKCDNLGAGMKRPGLHRFYQRECSHVLYGPRCLANKAIATRTYTAFGSDPTDRRIGVDFGNEGPLTDQEKDQFVGGLLEFEGPNGPESRQIVNMGPTWIDVDSPVAGRLVEFQTFDIVLGCQRNMDACTQLHNNIVNYGGFPYIPNKDVHGKNNHT